ncbi:MAG: hypothetical protein SVS15_04170 [Thermodesulfobacteriota bacterium]|nr:hypothetical protein [Thermodesulfobacteriota bacterium]
MNETSAFPDWTRAFVLKDALFAEAYNHLPAARRAWLKKLIAELYALFGPAPAAQTTKTTLWDAIFYTAETYAPLNFAVLFLDDTVRSPVQAAAAALPAVLSGIPEVIAVRTGTNRNKPGDILAAFELCGLETVLGLGEKKARELLKHLAAQGQGAVLSLGEKISKKAIVAGASSKGLKLWSANRSLCSGDFGLWAERGVSWDFDVLAWAHPDARIAVWGTKAPGFKNFYSMPGKFEDFQKTGYRVVLAPEHRIAALWDQAGLVLGPGQEACWAWPELNLEFFRQKKLALYSQNP